MTRDLLHKKCVPCEGGTPPLTQEKVDELAKQLKTKWEIEGNRKIHQKFQFEDFKQSMDFVNKIAKIAEEEQHHPNISIFYNQVIIELWTHAIGGLSENDFILARKIEHLI